MSFLLVSIEKPHNPLINAGALISMSLILSLIRRDLSLSDKFEYVKDNFKVPTACPPTRPPSSPPPPLPSAAARSETSALTYDSINILIPPPTVTIEAQDRIGVSINAHLHHLLQPLPLLLLLLPPLSQMT